MYVIQLIHFLGILSLIFIKIRFGLFFFLDFLDSSINSTHHPKRYQCINNSSNYGQNVEEEDVGDDHVDDWQGGTNEPYPEQYLDFADTSNQQTKITCQENCVQTKTDFQHQLNLIYGILDGILVLAFGLHQIVFNKLPIGNEETRKTLLNDSDDYEDGR